MVIVEPTLEEATKVQSLIERHLAQYLTRSDIIVSLAAGHGIDPGVTALGRRFFFFFFFFFFNLCSLLFPFNFRVVFPYSGGLSTYPHPHFPYFFFKTHDFVL